MATQKRRWLARTIQDQVVIHGVRSIKEYRSWQCMKSRCLYKKDIAYPRYGGRGITVCEKWINSFEAFFADIGRKPSPRHTLDRIDNDKGYEPGNVRWADKKTQSRNRRDNHIIEWMGQQRTIVEWAEIIGVKRITLQKDLIRDGLFVRHLKRQSEKLPLTSETTVNVQSHNNDVGFCFGFRDSCRCC